MAEQKLGGVPGLWIALLAILGLYTLPPRTSAPSAQPAAGEPAQTVEQKLSRGDDPRSCPEDQLTILAPLKEFWGTTRPALTGTTSEADSNGPSRASPNDQIDTLLRNTPTYRLNLLIATVPDPTLFAGKDWFDTVVDALQRAIEAQGFVLDRYRLPVVRSDTLPSGTTRVLLNRAESPTQGVGAPGLLLFRDTTAKTSHKGLPLPAVRLLGILLVPESPTRGVDKAALQSAFTIVRQHQRLSAMLHLPIQVVGPNFSGSQTSMELAMRSWLEANFKGDQGSKLDEFDVVLKSSLRNMNPIPADPRSLIVLTQTDDDFHLRVYGANGSLTVNTRKSELMRIHGTEALNFAQVRTKIENLDESLQTLWQIDHLDKEAKRDLIAQVSDIVNVARFDWCSGVASSIEREWFEKSLRGRANFNATVHKTKDGPRLLARFFKEHLRSTPAKILGFGDRPRIALLAESNTEYGTDVMSEGGRSDDSIEQSVYPFPMRISQLRTAYLRRGLLPSSEGNLLPSLERLPQPFEQGGHDDVVPSNSSEASASNDELAISQILVQIARRGFSYVAILATERDDTLFLARMVRHFCPNTRLVLFNTSSAFWHPDNIRSLRGSIVVSEYPLAPRNQSWSFPFQGEAKLLGMPTEWAQGTYNATTLQLCELLRGNEIGGRRKGHDALLEYGQPFDELMGKSLGEESTSIPPLWISLVGQHGFYPLYYGNEEKTDPSYLRPRTREMKEVVTKLTRKQGERLAPMVQESWLAVFNFASVAIFVWNFAYLFAYSSICLRGQGVRSENDHAGRGPGAWSWRWLGRQVEPWQSRKRHERTATHWRPWRARRALTLARFLVITSLYAFLCAPVLIPCWIDWGIARAAGYYVAVAVVVLGSSVVTLLISARLMILAAPPTPPAHEAAVRGEPVWVLPACALLTILTAIAFVLTANTNASHDPGTRLLYCERAMALTSGVSPQMPVLLLTLAVLTWSGGISSRLNLTERTTQPFPLRSGDSAVLTEISRHVRSMRRGIIPMLSGIGDLSWWALLAVFCVAFCPQMLLWLRLQSSFEPWWFDLLFWLGFSTILLLAWVGLFDLFYFWKKLNELLRQFVSLPMTRALDRLPSRVGANLGHPRALLPAHGCSLMERECDSLVANFSEVKPILSLWTGDEGHLLGDRHSGIGREGQSRARLVVRRQLIGLLFPFWKRRSLRLAFADARPDVDHTKTAADDAYWLPGPGRSGESPRVEGCDSEKAAARRWLDQAEDVVALTMVEYVNPYFAHLWDLVATLTITSLLLFLAITSYPFQPMRFCLALLGTTIVLAAGLLMVIFVQMSRNEFVSRISNTPPNQLTFDRSFLFNLVRYVLPMFAILIALSTDLADLIRSWIDPVLEMFG